MWLVFLDANWTRDGTTVQKTTTGCLGKLKY